MKCSYEHFAASVLVVLAQLSLICREVVGLFGSTSVVGVVDTRLWAAVDREEERAEPKLFVELVEAERLAMVVIVPAASCG